LRVEREAQDVIGACAECFPLRNVGEVQVRNRRPAMCCILKHIKRNATAVFRDVFVLSLSGKKHILHGKKKADDLESHVSPLQLET
jgi:hypothetical protein